MISKETLFAILEQAVQAPSGDNSQPWRFTWLEKDQTLHIYNLPDKDNPIFNYLQRGSLIAHGALIENIRLLSNSRGLRPRITLLPRNAEETLIAAISFEPGEALQSPLVASIPLRHTNRKPYESRPLGPAEVEALLACREEEDASLVLQQEADAQTLLAQAVSTAERVMLQYKPLHDYFFQMIRWTSAQETAQGGGLYVKTMELMPPQLLIFKLYSFWPIAKILNRIGLPAFIAQENAKIYKQSSGFLLFKSSQHTPESYIKLGSLLQRVWLTATQLDLSVQPVAGVLYLHQRLAQADATPAFPSNQRVLITSAVESIAKSFNANPDELRMLIRIGAGNPPTATARKRPPHVEIQNS